MKKRGIDLQHKRKKLFEELNLSDIKVFHKCNHFYYVKRNGRKEKEMKEKNSNYNIGSCSCCWKLHNTPTRLKQRAYELVNVYTKNLYSEPEKLTFNIFDLESTYYKWLYL